MGILKFLSSLFRGKPKPGKASRNGTDASVPPQLDIKIKPGSKTPSKPPRPKPAIPKEEALGFKVAGGRPDGKAERRRSYRVSYEGLVCRVKELNKVVRVRDISATGIALFFKGPRIKAGTRLHLVLGADGKALAKGLVMRVVRHDEGVVGGEFEELDRPHEDQINMLVLQAQKQRAERKHKPAT
ncbi:PilZ domain-containing protein [Paucidesulfovibrio longus]|uniref:PilZ domain-containing protein n=1 Tax=Paucidesulfovibrio longus TaxID=889 RepID=UPI0003B3036E|nr:PilZ domain-containing protein [Paucidesulfovibrio longus]